MTLPRHMRCWLAAVLVAGCGGPSSATIKTANEKYGQGDYNAAARLYEKSCKAGNGEACTRLGGMHLDGKGVKADAAAAVELYAEGCDHGDPRGCASLGHAYAYGTGVPRNDTRATAAFDKGCQAKHAEACAEYAISLWRGRGIAAAPARARELLDETCAAGSGTACFHLGVLLRMGETNVPKDPEAAELALRKGCALRMTESCAYLEKHRPALKREQQE